MTDPLAGLYESPEIRELLQQVETAGLAADLRAGEYVQTPPDAVSQLRIAAIVAFADLIGSSTVDSLLRSFTREADRESYQAEVAVLVRWTRYLEALQHAGSPLSIDDAFLFASAGLLARQPTEVRSVLRNVAVRKDLEGEWAKSADWPWNERVRGTISYALLLIIRQENRADVARAGELIKVLASQQRVIERDWLESRVHPRRDATTLLGYYHLAQALERLSEFLLAGSLVRNGQVVTDWESELRRLVVKGEEFLTLGGDAETQLWLSAVGITLWRLRADSIWVAGQGISRRIDELLHELARGERERHIFSLLPSQQDALRQSLLDPSRVAVVLQMPTSAGKTLLAEFAILQTFEAYKDEARIVYLVPTRALATQVHRTLLEDLRPLGVDVAAASSAFEEDPFEAQLLLGAEGVVVATPEKLDLMLRAHPKWLDSLRLVIVDEAHLLQDGERGVRLELLLANLRRERPQARLLLMTPFIDNATDIASWLGGARGLPITVQWRPAKLLLGLCSIGGGRSPRTLSFEWQDPFREELAPSTISLLVEVRASDVQSARDRVVFLAERVAGVGTILGLCTGSKVEAEEAATAVAKTRGEIPPESRTSALRLAIALAKSEYGPDAALGYCLERGTAFHHSALSATLRFLVEDQVRSGTIDFIMATTTLAQGINFPVAVVLVHSVHKPYGGGNLTPAEFWNIAGRAGRVGLVDKGLVIFVSQEHRHHFEHYAASLNESVKSALLSVLGRIRPGMSLKALYRDNEELRPFIQYLAHAAATLSPDAALANLEELLQASLANAQVGSEGESRALRGVARSYLGTLARRSPGYLHVVDTTGLGSFSFDELYARIVDDPLLRSGPREVMARGHEGLVHLVDALKWLPELELGVGLGAGPMSAEAVARVVQGWVSGRPVVELASEFDGADLEDRVRKAGTYVFSKVSQTIAWGAHAYVRGWSLRTGTEPDALPPADQMLPAYIQHGVRTPEAAVAALFGVPRQLAEPLGEVYRERFGSLEPAQTPDFLRFVEGADRDTWRDVTGRSALADLIDPEDVRLVWRQMQGLIE